MGHVTRILYYVKDYTLQNSWNCTLWRFAPKSKK